MTTHFLRLAAVVAAFAAPFKASAAVIDAGRPVRVRVMSRTAIVDDRSITATLIDGVYAGERNVIPPGATVTGRVERLRGTSTRDHVAAASGGDLTPPIGARIRFDTLTFVDGASMHIDATALVAADANAPSTSEWVKDYLLTQLPYHRRYVHRGAVLTMTFAEAATVPRDPIDAEPPSGPVPARLLTRIDTASASVGDPVAARLLAPVRGAGGQTVAGEGTLVGGRISSVARAGAFGRGGRVTVRFDAFQATASRADPPIRFVWPPLAALALVGARDPATADQSAFFGRAGAGWSGFLVIGAAVAQAGEPVAIGLGVWGLVHTTWINVLRRGRDVVLPADSVVMLSPPA